MYEKELGRINAMIESRKEFLEHKFISQHSTAVIEDEIKMLVSVERAVKDYQSQFKQYFIEGVVDNSTDRINITYPPYIWCKNGLSKEELIEELEEVAEIDFNDWFELEISDIDWIEE